MFDQITTILFDVGDTLYVSPPMEKAYPRRLAALLASTRGINPLQAECVLRETTELLKQKLSDPTKVRAMEELGFTRPQVHAEFCMVNPSEYLSTDRRLQAVICTLGKEYKLGIISNLKRVHLDHILAVLGLSSRIFSCGIVSEDLVEEIKPAPEPFLKAVAFSGGRPDQCLYVGDSPSKDMRPAKQLGMRTALIKRSPTKDDLAYADTSIADLGELLPLLPRITRYPEGSVNGRFQPPHNDHLDYMLMAKQRCDFLWIGITRYNVQNPLSCAKAPHRSERLANPLTFFERVQVISEMLLDAGVSRSEFSCIPFPIDEVDLLPDFISRSAPCFTTVCDAWNHEKVARLEQLGYKVIVLKEGTERDIRIRGERIRADICEGGRAWEVMVPPATVRSVYRLDLHRRLNLLANLPASDGGGRSAGTTTVG